MSTRMHQNLYLCCAFVFCFAMAQAAQPALPSFSTRNDAPPFIPTLRVCCAEQPVHLQNLAIQIDIQCGIAEVSLDMLFANPNDRVLEGELHFPLLPGQEVSGLALDVQGEMRRGVPVPKARGQEIFESVVRRNVDPALLEATQGNSYRLRIYPIPAKGTRRVAVRLLQPLPEANGMFVFRLPLAFAKHIDKFSVDAMVAAGAPPSVESGFLGLALERAGVLYRGEAEISNLSPEGWLVIRIPASETLDKSVNSVRWRDKFYFTATASVPMQTRQRALPKTATIVWDASGSGQNRDHAREYALLDRYFSTLGEGQVRLVVVRNVTEVPKEFTIRRGDWRELKMYLHGLAYDGGTNLASWKPTEDCSEYLLFTDGLANFGNTRTDAALPPMLPEQRLYAITASSEANHTVLRHASRGRLINLLQYGDDAAARLLLEERTIVRLAPEELAGEGEALLAPLDLFADADANRLRCRLAGWIKAGMNVRVKNIGLWLEHPDGSRESHSISVTLDESVPLHKGDDAPLSSRLWGRYAIMAMESDETRNRAAIARLGQKLGVVSRGTSLIVLETAADYVRYGVEPPASLQAEVALLRDSVDIEDGSIAYLPMKDLESLWARKVAWWEKDFTKTKAVKQNAAIEPAGTAATDRGFGGYDRNSDSYGFVGRSYDPMNPFAASDRPAEEPDATPPVTRRVLTSSVATVPTRVPTALAAGDPRVGGRMATEGSPRTLAPDRRSGAGDDAGGTTRIVLQAWQPEAAYMERLDKAKNEDMYAIYLDELPSHRMSNAFFLDMADRFFARGMPELGLRILSNLAEMKMENRQLLRMLAYRLLQAGETRLALGVLETVRELAPYEPQSLRDLAHVHVALGDRGQAAKLLYEVARRKWDDRFRDINTIALTELNALLASAEEPLDIALFDSCLIKNLSSDLRVVLTWDTDNTDMDLWVTDPDGEKCYCGNRVTRQGGTLSRDCTNGYGPEEFMLKKAKPGKYLVEVNYYGSSQQTLKDEVAVRVVLFTGFGTPKQKVEDITLRLKHKDDRVLVGEFTIQ